MGRKQTQRRFPGGMLLLFCGASLLFGWLMLSLGFEQLAPQLSKPDSWDIVPGYLERYELVRPTSNGAVYSLEYRYYVGGEEYILITQELLGGEPVLESMAGIYCDLYNPGDALLDKSKSAPPLLAAGVLLLVIPVVFLVGGLLASGVLSFRYVGLLELSMGLVAALFALLFTLTGGWVSLPFWGAAGCLLFRGVRRKP